MTTEEEGGDSTMYKLFAGFFGGDAGAKVAEKAEEVIASAKENSLEWETRRVADQRGFVGVSTLRDGKIFANTSVHLACYDVKRAIRNGYGVRVLYGAPGSGMTTTLHAAVRGKRLDGTVVGDRAIVFQTREYKAESDCLSNSGI
jgi:hypothetical protein